LLFQILSDVEDARKYFVPGISWHCFYFLVFMYKTIGSELPPSDENTVLVYVWFTYGSGTRIPLLNAANIRAILRHYKIPASLLLWYTWLSASSKCFLTNSVLRVEYFISLRYTFWAVKGKQS